MDGDWEVEEYGRREESCGAHALLSWGDESREERVGYEEEDLTSVLVSPPHEKLNDQLNKNLAHAIWRNSWRRFFRTWNCGYRHFQFPQLTFTCKWSLA